MSDEKPDTNATPGAGAGDSAPTQQIPRVTKGAARPPAKKAPASKPPPPEATDKPDAAGSAKPSAAARPEAAAKKAAPAPAKPSGYDSSTPGRTDKGRARDKAAAAAKTAMSSAKSAAKSSGSKSAAKSSGSKSSSDTKPGVAPAGGPEGRPLTARDYAKTTGSSASTTAVIPAVKDDAPKRPAMTMASDAGSSRRASLRLVRVEPWSVTRLSFAISVALMIVAVVATVIFWTVLEWTGVWGEINSAITGVLSDDSTSFDITDYLGFWRLVGLTLVLSAINVVLTTALATIGAHLYNLAAQLLGGVEVTFAEEKK